ncbi:sensor histidine kinase [Acuticoccus kandeliae]|uniref:sensor histidine kinase n=1 Tax=Acuticoccus kandeliae TaxID=2073160 RepID=UPI001472BDEB|nr:histidine kinase dimerization/phosphoacceptor domain -containing protein [Acuticoccus kandeliae]
MDEETLARIKATMLEQLVCSIDESYSLCEMILDENGAPYDYRLLDVSPSFEAMTGLKDAAGHTARELVGDIEQSWVDIYGKVVLTRTPVRFQMEMALLGRWFDVYAAPLDTPLLFAVIFRDVTQRKRAEDGMDAALQQQARLLRELNHRVMNSLGMISSIIALETRRSESEEHRESLSRIKRRVQSVADLYRTLTAADEVVETRADHFLQKVVDDLGTALLSNDQIRIETDLAPIALSTKDATPLGLIVNELLTNALKYAFAPDEGGRIDVRLTRDEEMVTLEVADDGRGGLGEATGTGLGRQLVDSFARQLGGTIDSASGPDGTTVRVTFPALADPAALPVSWPAPTGRSSP